MRYDWLLDETDEDPPCGPDLELADPDYANYILTAEGLLPASFFAFDRNTIDLREQTDAIADYLRQCRDLRLLCLEAKFRILFGQLAEFCECVIAIERLVDERWDHVHPRGEDGDFMLRSGSVAQLEDIKTGILPLEYAPLVTDRRHGAITYRGQRVALGEVPAREGETELDSATISEALSGDDHREDVGRIHGLVTGAAAALQSVASTFNDRAGYEQAPAFDGLVETLGHIAGLIVAARPDIAQQDVEEPEGDADADGDVDTDAAPSDDGAEAPAESKPIVIAGGKIEGSGDAGSALLAAVTYFVNKEPSNPALILVHQAHGLVGKSFVDAMQVLVPGAVEQARLKVLADKDLQLGIDQMRSLSAEAVQKFNTAQGAEDGGAVNGRSYLAESRPEAVALIRGVEQYFRENEPSSPIPMLLAKARQYLNMQFEVILADLIPKKESE